MSETILNIITGFENFCLESQSETIVKYSPPSSSRDTKLKIIPCYILCRWKVWQMVFWSQWWFIHLRRHGFIDLMILKLLSIRAFLLNLNGCIRSCHFALIISWHLWRSTASAINHPLLDLTTSFPHLCWVLYKVRGLEERELQNAMTKSQRQLDH